MRVQARRGIELAIWVLVGVVASRTWLLDGLPVPVLIHGGSMAETLMGPHREVVCGDCGFPFVCEWYRRTDDPRAVCPNCGYAGNDARQWPLFAGDRVLVDRATFQFRRPQRWEVVAFQTPGREREWSTKRTIGLPGETVSIRDGDVYVDGALLRKTWEQQQATSVLVHDAAYSPGRCTRAPPRWRPDAEKSRWRCEEGRFLFTGSSEASRIDWLSYRHWRRVPGQPDRIVEGPVLTDPLFEQGRRVRTDAIRPTSDLRLSFRWVRASGSGWIYVRAADGDGEFVLRIHAATRQAELFRNGLTLCTSASKRSAADRLPTQVDVSLYDRQVLVALDGETLTTFPYDRNASSASANSTPFSLGGWDGEIELDHVRVYRDIFYDVLPGHPSQWTLAPEDGDHAGEWFVVGDNPFFSNDSRTWTQGPGIPRSALIGKPLLSYRASRGTTWATRGGRQFRIPKVSAFRYIR